MLKTINCGRAEAEVDGLCMQAGFELRGMQGGATLFIDEQDQPPMAI
ncbi:MAG TPA: hypothetical protein PL002_07735 [Flavobacteriales bacterium]|jgi:hypothetical protein|nr:hypothetical protein [Flavobacteriales bacterium]HRT54362.1 hypothetical protein [Flavobacteriales bacterium]